MFDVYVIADALPRDALIASVERALRGAPPGRVGVLLRCKERPHAERRMLAERLRASTRARGARFLVHGDLALAIEVAADGVHLPRDGALREARAALGADRLIGISCHDAAALARARRGGADFATLSPVFEVAGKGPALGVAGFARGAAGAGLPVLALGGIDPGRAASLIEAGAAGVAVIRAVLAAHAPDRALRALLDAVNAARGEREP